MGKLSKAKKESLERLQDQLTLAKSQNNTSLVRIIQKVIHRIEKEDEGESLKRS
jgi:hypothetical protein